MDVATGTSWSRDDFCMSAAPVAPNAALAAAVYARVCRSDFTEPGFCLIDLGPDIQSQGLRRFMVALKRELQLVHRARTNHDLAIMWLARFDQQITTKPHRDGGPDECFLILGYERSPIRADLSVCDYSQCADDMGLVPSAWLARHNPMFERNEELLRAYTTRLSCFSNRSNQIVIINNSVASCRDGKAWQGVLHAAAVHNPSDDYCRIVNSMMVASVPLGSAEPVSRAQQEEFTRTSIVHRRGYDRTHLSDDA